MITLPPQDISKLKVGLKALFIAGLCLVLFVISLFVQNLVKEREVRQQEAFIDISSKWAGDQNILGPVLRVPYTSLPNLTGNTRYAYLLPDKLKIDAAVTPESRHRGVFEVMLYTSTIKMSGSFNTAALSELDIDPSSFMWNEATVVVDVRDPKGLKDEMKLQWNNETITLNPAAGDSTISRNAFAGVAKVGPSQAIDFSSTININGSHTLLFTPVGKETTVQLTSAWPDPSFTGVQLPDHKITNEKFVANWKSLAHTRKFPQVWKNRIYPVQDAAFGANFFIPVTSYQKTMRSVKYAILCIVLTFAAFFIIENVNKKYVHPFQYALVGLALILFYTLLLSISEYLGFNTAYLIAGIATIGLIAWFVKDLLRSSRLTSILAFILALMYSYVFTTLQLQDYSLILGSVGLFMTLAVVMHFSKKMQF